MSLYLGFDGGGTKSCALLFDENGPLGFGKSGGTNVNFTTLEDCRRNIGACLDQALAGAEHPEIDAAYTVIIGPQEVLTAEMDARAAIRRAVPLGEGHAGILAGALRTTGLVAMAGTGSDAFYQAADGQQRVVGAFGAILGDDGGGAWIGQQALRRAVAYGEGWGEPTLIRDLVYKRWSLPDRWALAEAVYGSPAPFRKVASAVPIVAEAARLGDAAARSIFAEAGRLMAVQMLALIAREAPPPEDKLCVCCGGAWKAHSLMYETFTGAMREGAPDVRVQKPAFEHFMAGPVLRLIEANPGIAPEEALAALIGPYGAYRIDW